ncbi:hypothetical protein ACHAPX_005516 [Trichoderma viride]|jgi:hypothetical protein
MSKIRYPEDTGSSTAMDTPSETTIHEIWDGRNYSVPWPGGVYRIFEKGTDNVIALKAQSLCLRDVTESHNGYDLWLCVEAYGYFGFFNPKSGTYLGHNGKQDKIYASAMKFKAWECFTPRIHPDGGYQLLTPYYESTLKMVSVADDGRSLVRRLHGTTLWEFEKVSRT